MKTALPAVLAATALTEPYDSLELKQDPESLRECLNSKKAPPKYAKVPTERAVDDETEPEMLVLEVWDRPWWRFTHALGFCTGGILFAIGTLLYYPAINDARHDDSSDVALLGVVTAWLYIIGSAGFLYVDLQEFFTFTDDVVLRINISCSAIGSTLYLIGSAGFLPAIYNVSPMIGVQGFIWGSAWIGCSQTWKLVRILTSTGGKGFDWPTINAAFVEGGAMVGAFCFLVGTVFFWKGPIEGDSGCVITCNNYELVLLLWTIGSFAFTFGGLSLAWRHAVMKMT